MAKLMSPNTTIWFVPLIGIVNYLAPKASEITAGVNLSAAIVTGYTLAATDSDTDDSKTIVDEGNVATPTFGNYEASLSFYRDGIGDTPTVFTTAVNLFMGGRVEGWLISRHGYKSTVAATATTQLVSIFRVVSDFYQDVEGDGGAPIQVTVPFRPQGQMALNIPIAAG
jgi:hypothetical protein